MRTKCSNKCEILKPLNMGKKDVSDEQNILKVTHLN